MSIERRMERGTAGLVYAQYHPHQIQNLCQFIGGGVPSRVTYPGGPASS